MLCYVMLCYILLYFIILYLLLLLLFKNNSKLITNIRVLIKNMILKDYFCVDHGIKREVSNCSYLLHRVNKTYLYVSYDTLINNNLNHSYCDIMCV